MPVVLADYYFSAHVESRLAGLIEMLVWGGLITLAAAQIGSLIYGLRHQVRAFTRQGQYEIVQLIGKGGMGAVYEARHALLRRRTALKLLPPREADGDSIRRFEREARLASRLTHPNTISIFDFGQSPGGLLYIAMELVEGETLETVVRRDGPLPAARTHHILLQLAGSLAEAHAMGLLHRDIKPDNLFSTVADDGPERVILIDFGLARTLRGDKVTAENTLLGTPHYMPPELVTSGWTKAGDVYSFAVVLCELYTGRLPFDYGTPMELMQRKMYNDAPLVSELATDRVPALVNELFRQSLSRNPDDRPKTCGDLLGALRMLSHIRVTPLGVRHSVAPPHSKTG